MPCSPNWPVAGRMLVVEHEDPGGKHEPPWPTRDASPSSSSPAPAARPRLRRHRRRLRAGPLVTASSRSARESSSSGYRCLEALARSRPGAATSPREGLAESLTIGRLGVPPTLARTLRSTNTIESMIATCRAPAANVKRWQDGQMVLRCIAAGKGEAGQAVPPGQRPPPPASPASRPGHHHHPCYTQQGGCRLITAGRTATEVPRRSGHPRFSYASL